MRLIGTSNKASNRPGPCVGRDNWAIKARLKLISHCAYMFRPRNKYRFRPCSTSLEATLRH